MTNNIETEPSQLASCGTLQEKSSDQYVTSNFPALCATSKLCPGLNLRYLCKMFSLNAPGGCGVTL